MSQSLYGLPLEQSLVETAVGNPTCGQPGGGPAIALFQGDIDEADDRTYQQQRHALFGQIDINFLLIWKLDLGADIPGRRRAMFPLRQVFIRLATWAARRRARPHRLPSPKGRHPEGFYPRLPLPTTSTVRARSMLRPPRGSAWVALPDRSPSGPTRSVLATSRISASPPADPVHL